MLSRIYMTVAMIQTVHSSVPRYSEPAVYGTMGTKVDEEWQKGCRRGHGASSCPGGALSRHEIVMGQAGANGCDPRGSGASADAGAGRYPGEPWRLRVVRY